MHKDDALSEFIGALANIAVANESDKLSEAEALNIFKLMKIETSQGDDYQRLGGLVKKAQRYWTEKDCPHIVDNITAILPF